MLFHEEMSKCVGNNVCDPLDISEDSPTNAVIKNRDGNCLIAINNFYQEKVTVAAQHSDA